MPRKEARKGICEKCGREFYVHAHHIEPKGQFRDSQKTVDLCPNCHIHENMNLHVKDPTDREEVLKVWDQWYNLVKVTWVLLIGLVLAWWLL